MRIKMILFATIIFALTSCGSSSNNEEAKKAIEKEVQVMDSISTEVEKVTTDIEKASSELDELINDL